jgi:hypothetical protein
VSGVFNPINPAFYAAVLDVRAYATRRFMAEDSDLCSEAFLARFPFTFVEEFNEDVAVAPLREKLQAAAFTDQFRSRTEEAIDIFYANRGGGNAQSYLLDMIDDFLNYALLRTVGLSEQEQMFDDLYRQFETDLFSDTYTLNVIALLENISYQGGAFQPTAGLSFAWADCYPGVALNTSHLRKRAVPYLEIKNSCHPLAAGRSVAEKHNFFVLAYEEAKKKEKKGLTMAYIRSEEITRKAVLALRLLTSAPVYAEYRGFRTLGHYSRGMVLMNYPDQRIDEGISQDLSIVIGRGLEMLFPPLLAASTDRIAVLDIKIEDAFKRHRRGAYFGEAKTKAAIDRLLDYCQVLEAIIQAQGSFEIALCTAVLLRAASAGTGSASGEVFEFIKKMYKLRNDVMHGRIDTVLERLASTNHNITAIDLFYNYIRQLAILYLLNFNEEGRPDLRQFAHRLALGETVHLKTLHGE